MEFNLNDFSGKSAQASTVYLKKCGSGSLFVLFVTIDL